MTATATEFNTLNTVSLASRGFYVPRFEVKIENAGLPRDVLRDVIEVTYKDNIEELDSFEVSVNNWDPSTRKFKYIGSEEATLSDTHRLFEPCTKKVELRMGYTGDAELPLIMTGNFTTMEPSFPSNGPPTLSVRGLNVLHKLRRKKYDGGWFGEKDSAIVENIATLRDRELGNAKRFPLPVRIDDNAKSNETPIDFVGQKSEYDIDFIWKRAQERGYIVAIRYEPEEHLFFGPSNERANPVNYQLEWGKSLVDLTPTLTTANQFKSVTVRGWDRRRQRAISETVDLDDRELRRLNPNLRELVQQCDPREEYVVDRPVFTTEDAKRRARALLLDQSKQMVKASGTTVGLPALRAGTKVNIMGIGFRLQGKYFVTETTHTINDNGYITKFKARREDDGEEEGASHA